LKGKIREILNKIKWMDSDNYSNYIITYIHRGVPNNQKTILFDRIIDITPSFIVFKDENAEENTYIPFHRILKIINKKEKIILWRKIT